MPLHRLIAALTLLAASALSLPAQDTASLAKGKQLFSGMCSRCHGLPAAAAKVRT